MKIGQPSDNPISTSTPSPKGGKSTTAATGAASTAGATPAGVEVTVSKMARTLESAKNGDKKAISAFNEFGKNLSDAVKIILYTLDPEMIILGGSISNAFEFFVDAVWKGLDDFMYPIVLKTLKIEKSELKNSAVLGAAALVYNFK
jgi:predicted NBD/HSP70 family sugar kinase